MDKLSEEINRLEREIRLSDDYIKFISENYRDSGQMLINSHTANIKRSAVLLKWLKELKYRRSHDLEEYADSYSAGYTCAYREVMDFVNNQVGD